MTIISEHAAAPFDLEQTEAFWLAPARLFDGETVQAGRALRIAGAASRKDCTESRDPRFRLSSVSMRIRERGSSVMVAPTNGRPGRPGRVGSARTRPATLPSAPPRAIHQSMALI